MPFLTRKRAVLVGVAVLVLGLAALTSLDAGVPAPAGPRPVSDRLSSSIHQLQERLRRLPDDATAWAELGSAYVEQARASADPQYYAQAAGALDRSVALRPSDNASALLGQGALANARHDFAAARRLAEQAIALNPASAEAYGVLADATTQLGDAAAATAAVQRMLDLRPGVASFTRASYELELHGRVGDARVALERALEAATTADERAFCRYHLGQLAWNAGDLAEATAQYDRGLDESPGNPALLQGRAKAQAAAGDVGDAISGYERLTQRVPSPQYLLEYGELLEAAGRAADARAQYALLARLFAAQGQTDQLTAAYVAADHGDPAEAVRLAGAEWQRRQSVFSADALAWALHAAGRDAEALPMAERADTLGRQDATLDYHRGMILAALGRSGDAAFALDEALRTNPHFSPLHATTARRTLDSLRGAR